VMVQQPLPSLILARRDGYTSMVAAGWAPTGGRGGSSLTTTTCFTTRDQMWGIGTFVEDVLSVWMVWNVILAECSHLQLVLALAVFPPSHLSQTSIRLTSSWVLVVPMMFKTLINCRDSMKHFWRHNLIPPGKWLLPPRLNMSRGKEGRPFASWSSAV